MKSLPLLLLSIAAGAVTAGPSAPITPADPKLAHDLVRQLASPKYRERERAAAELVRMGRAARPALTDGKKHADPEVQSRCEQLLPQALALDLAFRVDRFLTDTDGKLEHDLPLLKAFREQVGTDENARKLYSDMVKANGTLLEAVEEEPARLTDRVQERYLAMYAELFGSPFGAGFRGGYRPGAMNAAELCAVLFVSTQPAYKPAQPDWMLANLYTQPGFTNVLKHEKDGTAHRKLFFNYVEARADDNLVSQCAWMFTQHRLKAGADVMARVLQNKKGLQVYSRAQAMCCLGTLGSKEHLPALEPFLKDDTQVQPFFARGGGQRGEVKVKDVALAMTIHLSGKNPKDYGFGMWNVFRDQLIQYHTLGFATDEERATAFKKWAADAAQPAAPEEVMTTLRVNLGPRSYDITIGSGSGGFPGFVCDRLPQAARGLFVADSNTRAHAERLAAALGAATVVTVPAGEPSKSLAETARLYSQLAARAADRKTPVIAVGGGVVGDLAGFAAATYNRGLPLVMVPTTLLAMVDSSVGGKVGINLPEGKNLVGAFHQPAGVWIDTAFLDTLPDREYRSGLAEVVKYGVILDAEFFGWLEANADAVLRRDPRAVAHVVARSCRLKADVVEWDEREETGLRAVLNYGHTFAHAFESVGGYGAWLHGEAVAAGMVCASRLAERRGLIGADLTARQVDLLKRFGLPTTPRAEWPADDLLAVMRRDKKNVAGRLRFVLPTRLGHVSVFDDVPEPLVREVLATA